MVKNVTVIRTGANWFKNDDFDISDKERSGRPAAVEEELRKDGKKSWKIFRLIYIVSIFFIIINKIVKNRQELLHRFNINVE